eukprot:164781-Amorphochlora_amoeboformis.AAC.1
MNKPCLNPLSLSQSNGLESPDVDAKGLRIAMDRLSVSKRENVNPFGDPASLLDPKDKEGDCDPPRPQEHLQSPGQIQQPTPPSKPAIRADAKVDSKAGGAGGAQGTGAGLAGGGGDDFEEEPPQFLCPITQELMTEPVNCKGGMSCMCEFFAKFGS